MSGHAAPCSCPKARRRARARPGAPPPPLRKRASTADNRSRTPSVGGVARPVRRIGGRGRRAGSSAPRSAVIIATIIIAHISATSAKPRGHRVPCRRRAADRPRPGRRGQSERRRRVIARLRLSSRSTLAVSCARPRGSTGGGWRTGRSCRRTRPASARRSCGSTRCRCPRPHIRSRPASTICARDSSPLTLLRIGSPVIST